MILERIKRKFHNLRHPVAGEIWMLHRVVEQRSADPQQSVLEVTPGWLEEKILNYQKKGYSFVPIDHLPERGHWVCVTFDDGYRDNYTHAYPLLKALGIPFTIYATTGFIDNHMPMWWYPGQALGIKADELKQMDADPLCTVGTHTVSHPHLDTLPHEQQYQEILASILSLEHLLNHPVRHLSLPHGAYDDNTVSICRELGIHSVVTSWGGPVRRRESHFPYPRINITQP